MSEIVVSSRGMEGRPNEDVAWAGGVAHGTLAVVADGFHGADAAGQAVAIARETFEKGRVFDAWFWKNLLGRIHDGLDASSETAIVVCHLVSDRLYATACGDAHAYVFAGGALSCLTEGRPKYRMGGRAFDAHQPGAGVFETRIDPGTRIALVSNGVWEYLPDGELERALRDSFFESVADDLTWRAAPDGKWQDDATAVVVQV